MLFEPKIRVESIIFTGVSNIDWILVKVVFASAGFIQGHELVHFLNCLKH